MIHDTWYMIYDIWDMIYDLWYYDIMILWYYDIMIYDIMILWYMIYELWYYDIMILWYYDIMIFWYYDIIILLYYDIIISLYHYIIIILYYYFNILLYYYINILLYCDNIIAVFLAVATSKKCILLWCELYFQIWIFKMYQVRSIFCNLDFEKIQAVVARNTFGNQNVYKAPCSDHLWKLRYRKNARRCGAKYISKSKY